MINRVIYDTHCQVLRRAFGSGRKINSGKENHPSIGKKKEDLRISTAYVLSL